MLTNEVELSLLQMQHLSLNDFHQHETTTSLCYNNQLKEEKRLKHLGHFYTSIINNDKKNIKTDKLYMSKSIKYK